MNNEKQQQIPSWLDSLSMTIRMAADPLHYQPAIALDDHCTRINLVTRTRWILLLVIGLYGIFASASYALSSIKFTFNWLQSLFLVIAFLAVVAYNFAFSLHCSRFQRIPYLLHLQIFLDLFFVTILIHFTGGAVSWVWPVYLLVTLEAAFLLDRKGDVWLIGSIGGLLYGVLLILESSHIIPTISMPFVGTSLHDEFLFQLLMWFWVAGMNAAVAIIAAFLMDTIRDDHNKLKASEDALMGFINSANDLIFCCTPEGIIIYLNQVCRDRLHLEDVQHGTKSLFDMLEATERQGFVNAFRGVADKDGQAGHLEIRFTTGDGNYVDVEMNLSGSRGEGETTVIWGVCRDITERKAAQQELYKLAHHDILTGLPNRILLQDRLDQAKALAARMNSSFALLFMDLDRFKIINDTLGHSIGDELLRLVAGRLRRTLREVDTVARIGGDEFVIVLVNVSDKTYVSSLADKILKSLSLPFHLRDHELFITTSLGVCLYPDDEQSPEEMMKKADIAMYHAKALGRNNFQFYNDEMDQNASRRFVISNSLRRGLEQNEFRVYYQPKVDVTSGRIVAMEALVRWEHPELGLLAPQEFIQLAEENGLIVQLGEWVLREACRQNVIWHTTGMDDIRVAVNLSGYQLQHNTLLASVKSILKETGLDPAYLEFEITESVIMQNPDFAVSILSEITDLGIHISIDDFGTGYSSLAHLKRFSVNTLKIDKSFVRDVSLNTTDAAIATAIIAMGSSLKLNVIAEGVETQEQYDFLKDNNCDQVQGFLFSRPLPADEIVSILQKNRGEMEKLRNQS